VCTSQIVDTRCCSVLQCIAVCCSMLQCVAVCCSVLQYVAACCSMLQCVAVCCSVLQYVVPFCCAYIYKRASVDTRCCSVLQCVAACCSLLQSVTMRYNRSPRSRFNGTWQKRPTALDNRAFDTIQHWALHTIESSTQYSTKTTEHYTLLEHSTQYSTKTIEHYTLLESSTLQH